jgi:hypothetical protein
MSVVVLRIVEINSNDLMSSIDKENFKLLYGYIEKDYLYAAAHTADTLDYSLSGDLTVVNKNGPYTMSLHMGIDSINTFFGIKDIHLSTNTDTLSIESNSDWLSPYMVKADLAKDKTDLIPSFTGGWHSLDSVSDSEPSSFMKSYEVYADGKKIIGKTTGNAQTVHVIVNQLIKGYNTDDYVLEEYILYTLINNEIRVRVKTFALQDASIETFYGIETHNKSFNKHITYHFENQQSKTLGADIISDSGPRDYKNKLSYISLNSWDHPFILSGYMTHVAASKTLPLLPDGVPEAFTEAYGKSYFNVINGNPLSLKTRELFEWSGILKFSME